MPAAASAAPGNVVPATQEATPARLPSDPPAPPPLAGGPAGPRALRPYLDTVLDALAQGAADRRGPLPAGGPAAVTHAVRTALGHPLPTTGTGAHTALHTLVRTLAAGSADPADPHCAAHLHTPPLAVATAADTAASALNPSLDSWDQAPAAAALEAELTRALAAETYPAAHHPDALVTTGGTEANQLALLLAREHLGPGVHIICGANAHHSIHRAAWLLGMRTPHTLPTPDDTLDPATVHTTLRQLPGPALLIATAGTTDTGALDPLPALAAATRPGDRLHVDAAYAGPLLLTPRHAPLLDGLAAAHTTTLDFHKLGWQPVATGLFAVRDATDLAPLAHRADYLNAGDDTDAGLPDLLGRSLRTTRRADILKLAVTLQALGRDGIARLVEQTLAAARHLAALIDQHPGLELYGPPPLSTVLFRPAAATDEQVAAVRRRLLTAGHAVLGRATAAGRLWLKATLLNPHTRPDDLDALVSLAADAHRAGEPHRHPAHRPAPHSGHAHLVPQGRTHPPHPHPTHQNGTPTR